jgi:hypothetical protein
LQGVAYQTIFSIQGQRDTVGVLNYGAEINFSQIFSGSPQFYPGSIVQVQEILTIATTVYDPQLVAVDLGWFSPKKRLGTYQVIDSGGLNLQGEGFEGYLTSQIHRIQQKSFYTITANPNTIVAQHEQISLDTCNFYLQPEVYLFPGRNEPVTGFRTYDLNPAFLGSVTLSKAPLADTPYNTIYSGVGLHLKPGVEGNYIQLDIAIVNDIYTDYPSAQVPQCEFIAPGCQQAYAAFVAGSNGEYFDSLGSCEAVAGQNGCVESVWVCPTDPLQTFPIWLRNNT